MIGCLPGVPRQVQLSGLPLLLMKEEIDLLIKENVAQLVEWIGLKEVPSEEMRLKYSEYEQKSIEDQIKIYREERKRYINENYEEILEKQSKKKKIDPNGEKLDKETLRKQLLNDVKDQPASQTVIHTNLEHPKHLTTIEPKNRIWNFPRTIKEQLRSATFRDLWRRQFYVTEGEKFGGDFLAYPGDPVLFHAKMIVICVVEAIETFTERELVAKCRLGTNVNKNVMFSYFQKDSSELIYKRLKWTGKK